MLHELTFSYFKKKKFLVTFFNSQKKQSIEKELFKNVDLFVRLELAENYGDLVTFVEEAEKKMKGPEGSGEILYGISGAQIENLVKNFSRTWKNGIDHMNTR